MNPRFCRHAGHADGARRGLLLRPLGRPVVSHRHHARQRARSCSTSHRSSCPIGPIWAPSLQGVATQRKLTGTDRAGPRAVQPRGAPPLPGESRGRGPADLTRANRNLGLEAVADYRWIPVGVHYSLLELPTTPMRPRYADERVGYFVSAIKDFSRDTAESFFVRYVNRWRLEKRTRTPPQRAGQADRVLHRSHRAAPSGGPGSGPESWSGTAPSRRPASGMPSRCSMRRTTRSGAPKTPGTPRCAGPPPIAASTRSGPPTSIPAPARS